MTQWTPVWRVIVDSVEVTDVTLANLTITSGRTDINSQPVAGYCNVELINLANTSYTFNVGTQITIEVQDSTATYKPIFGGYITDFEISVISAGSVGFTTAARITALGALSKLPKIIDNGILSQDHEGDQIYDLLKGYLLGQWNEVPAAQTWLAYDPVITWANAQNLGLGEIDQPGNYEMVARSSNPATLYDLVSQLANSGLGIIYEDSSGNIGYADSTHRQDYLANNGYTILDANNALGVGISSVTRSGDIRNKFTITYNSGSGTYTAEDAQSQVLYGLLGSSFDSSAKHSYDAEDIADRFIALRSAPFPKFQSITFPLGNSEIDNSDRDALLNIFIGQPVWIQNIPGNITDGSFQGYIEGWTFQASYNSLNITFNASPISFSQVAVKWESVSAAESWNTLSNTLTWINAIGAVA
jgi:hypothetical protein